MSKNHSNVNQYLIHAKLLEEIPTSEAAKRSHMH